MSGTLAHVANLSDEELYKELTKYGFPAGPVVASTRKLYERKLCHILEDASGDEQEPLTKADEIEEQLTQPVRRCGTFQSAAYYAPSREQGKDDMRTHSVVSSSSYLGTVRGVGGHEDNTKASPSWLSNSSATQPYTLSSWNTYGSSGDESVGKSQHIAFSQITQESPRYFARHRTTLSDTTPAGRPDVTSRYRLTGFSDERASVLNRHKPERQRNKSVSVKVQLIVAIILVLFVIVFAYMAYDAWHENDPYMQLEQEVVKIIEERELTEKQD